MKNKILEWHRNRNGWLYLIPWIITGVLGSLQITQPYIDKKIEGIEPPGAFFAFMAYTPVGTFLIDAFLAYLILGVFGLFHWILGKKLSLKFKWFFFIFPASIVICTAYLAIKDFVETMTWGFYILSLQDLIWLVFLMIVVQIYWELIKNKGLDA